MKNKAMLITILLINLTQFQLYSQERLQKGNHFIGGGIGFSSRDESEDDNNPDIYKYDYSKFSFSPYSGRFIKDGLAIGISMQLSNENSEKEYGTTNDIRKTKTDDFSIGASLFLKKFWPVGEKFGAFITPDLGYRLGRNDTETIGDNNNSTSEINSSQVNLSTNLGLYYFITPRFSFETNLANITISRQTLDEETRYTTTETTSNDTRKVNNLNFRLINQFSFDKIIVINYYF